MKKWQNYFYTKTGCLSWRTCTFFLFKPEKARKRVFQINQSQFKEKFPELQEKVSGVRKNEMSEKLQKKC